MTPPVLPKEAVDAMASRAHRLHHWLWHEVRNSWLSYPDDVRQQIKDLGWEPPRPALNEAGRPVLDNDAGEDFLYMHRRMLVEVSEILNRVKDPAYPRIPVWSVPPPPGDPDFPVPDAWFDATVGSEAVDRRSAFETLKRIKSDVFYDKRMMFWQKLFTDHGFLRGISLGELGTLMELTIHASMHLRWASAPAGHRPDPGPTEGHTIDPRWDDPRYDFLGDTYSSHVHPVFWSLHGWIDDRLEDWKIANGVYGNEFWKGTWSGPWPGEAPPPAPGPLPADASAPQPAPPSDAQAGAAGSSAPGPAAEPASQPPATEAGSQPPATPPASQPPTAEPAPPHVMPGHGATSASAPDTAPAGPEEHAHPAHLEEVMKIIGRCGIFHAGYKSILSRPFG